MSLKQQLLHEISCCTYKGRVYPYSHYGKFIHITTRAHIPFTPPTAGTTLPDWCCLSHSLPAPSHRSPLAPSPLRGLHINTTNRSCNLAGLRLLILIHFNPCHTTRLKRFVGAKTGQLAHLPLWSRIAGGSSPFDGLWPFALGQKVSSSQYFSGYNPPEMKFVCRIVPHIARSRLNPCFLFILIRFSFSLIHLKQHATLVVGFQ